MTKPIDIKRFAHLLSAQGTLDEIERTLRLTGDRRTARKIAAVRRTLSRAIAGEEEGLYRSLSEYR
ncbi:MAG: hypothetical protein JSR81_10710 [Proteobacteria bacterium]|nr:hypothetical protein [Pseudomonadota bacterium]